MRIDSEKVYKTALNELVPNVANSSFKVNPQYHLYNKIPFRGLCESIV
jgi:hypothetical protein